MKKTIKARTGQLNWLSGQTKLPDLAFSVNNLKSVADNYSMESLIVPQSLNNRCGLQCVKVFSSQLFQRLLNAAMLL